MTAPPKRHWFLFSRRTLFVLVAVAAVPLGWLGWNLKTVRERKAVLTAISASAPKTGKPHEVLIVDCLEIKESDPTYYSEERYDQVRVSRVRRLCGDFTYLTVAIPHTCETSLIERAELAFPEAKLLLTYPEGIGAARWSLYAPAGERQPNFGNVFKTGIIEKQPE